jgi:hypothetical protein
MIEDVDLVGPSTQIAELVRARGEADYIVSSHNFEHLPFDVVEIFDAGGEFHAHLRLNRSTGELRPANYEATRNSLLRRVQDEAAETSTKYQKMQSALEGLGEAKERIRQLEETAQRLNEDNVYQCQLSKSIRGSLIWKLASPLWRLETRGARKKNRRKFPK